MQVSGVFKCSKCGEERDFGKSFDLPPAPYEIPCQKCGHPLLQSVPDEIMGPWLEEIEKKLTPEEKKLLGRD